MKVKHPGGGGGGGQAPHLKKTADSCFPPIIIDFANGNSALR